MRIAIVGSGRLSETFLQDIQQGDMVIGVDRGAAWLLSHNIRPDAAIGDFDSVTKKELALIKKSVKHVEFHPADKDFTDMELAVAYALKQKPKEVVIYGGIGTRADHTLGALHLLERFLNARIDAKIIDETNEIMLVTGRRTIDIAGTFKKTSNNKASLLRRLGSHRKMKQDLNYRYVSILPYTKSATVTLKNFRYEVSALTLTRGMTRGISNEFVGPNATIDVHEGIVWVIQSRD